MPDDLADYEDSDYAANETVDALQDVERAVLRVEKAVTDKWSSAQWILATLIAAHLWSLPGEIWHAKWRYALWNNVSSDKVIVDDHPHDCAFLAAPFGEKYCHYDREVSTLQWATSTTGNPIASFDEGKTWSTFTPDSGIAVPRQPTVVQVYIRWKRIDE